MKKFVSLLLSLLILIGAVPTVLAQSTVKTDLPEEYFYKTNEFNGSRGVFYGKSFCFEPQDAADGFNWYMSFDNGATWITAECNEAEFSPRVPLEDFLRSEFFLLKATAFAEGEIIAQSRICKCMSVPLFTEKLPASIYVDINSAQEQNGTEGYIINGSIKAVGCGELSYSWYYTDSTDTSSPYKLIENQTTAELSSAFVPKSAVLRGTVVFCRVTDTAGNTVSSPYASIKYVRPPEVSLPESVEITYEMLTDGKFALELPLVINADEDSVDSVEWYAKTGEGEWEKLLCSETLLSAEYSLEQLLRGVSIKCKIRAFSVTETETPPCELILLPYFTAAPYGRLSVLGENAEISAQPISSVPCQIKWYVSEDNRTYYPISDEELYSGFDTAVLTLKNTTRDSLRPYYRCCAIVNGKKFFSPWTRLKKPVITVTKQPEDQKSLTGLTAYFSTDATGMDLSFTWEFYDPALGVWSDAASASAISVSGENDTTLSVRVKDEKAFSLLFRCTVSDGTASQVTKSVRLIKAQPDDPDISSQIIPGDVNLDGNIFAEDARLALRIAVGLDSFAPSSAHFIAADWDNNGRVSASDARSILRVAVGLSA